MQENDLVSQTRITYVLQEEQSGTERHSMGNEKKIAVGGGLQKKPTSQR